MEMLVVGKPNRAAITPKPQATFAEAAATKPNSTRPGSVSPAYRAITIIRARVVNSGLTSPCCVAFGNRLAERRAPALFCTCLHMVGAVPNNRGWPRKIAYTTLAYGVPGRVFTCPWSPARCLGGNVSFPTIRLGARAYRKDGRRSRGLRGHEARWPAE